MKYHSNSNIFKTCRIPQLLRLIWAKTKLVFAQISLKSWGILHVLKIFEFEWVKLVLNWAIVRLHFADAKKGETNTFVPYKSLKWFWTIAVGNQRYLWVLVILWDPPGGPPGPPGGPRGPERVYEESNDMYKQDLLYNLFVALKKAFFCLLSNLIHFFNIFSRGLNKGGGGNCPPSFTFQFHLLPCWLVHRSSYLLRRSHCEVNYKYSIISFSSGSLWFRNFRQFSVAVKKMASEHARITNSKQHLLTEATFSLSDG